MQRFWGLPVSAVPGLLSDGEPFVSTRPTPEYRNRRGAQNVFPGGDIYESHDHGISCLPASDAIAIRDEKRPRELLFPNGMS